MDYAAAQATFLGAPPAGQAPPRLPDRPARRLRDAAEPIATIGFWGSPAYDRLAELGLDFLTGYVWARAAPMGEPSPAVVVAAFGVFEPGLVMGLYEEARSRCSRAAVLAAREQGAVQSLRALLGDDAEEAVADAADLLRRATAVASADLAGRPLFAGLVSLAWPDDPFGRLWHAVSLLREYRGDVHQAANVAAGLSGVQMNLVTEYWVGWPHGAYAGTRGWTPEEIAAADAALVDRGWVADGVLTPVGQQERDEIEARTDAALDRVLAAVGDGRDLARVTARLDAWSAQIIAAGAAPQDPYKRVSG
jgi:hypothetical protein